MSQVFLCYSRTDEREAELICNELRRLGLTVWWDRELESGTKWASEVAQALEASDSMIVLVTPNAMNSDLVNREMEQAIRDERFGSRVYPVIIQPTYAVPWYFRRLSVFDATTNRTQELSRVAKAIQISKEKAAGQAKGAKTAKRHSRQTGRGL